MILASFQFEVLIEPPVTTTGMDHGNHSGSTDSSTGHHHTDDEHTDMEHNHHDHDSSANSMFSCVFMLVLSVLFSCL